MIKYKLAVFFLFVFVACNSSREPSTSKEKLSKEKMVEVLLDVHLAEATFNVIERNKKSADSIINNEYAFIFKNHNVKADDFFSTYNYYIANPALMDSAYGELVTHITTLQSQAFKQPELKLSTDSSAYKDSIRNQMVRRLKSHKNL